MEQSDENLLETVRQELFRLGVQGSNFDHQNEAKKSYFYQNGSKILGFTANNLMKHKIGHFSDSPKNERNSSNNNFEAPKTPKHDKIKKGGSKSPFSTKSRIERKSGRRKKEALLKVEETSKAVFGCDLEMMELCSAFLRDGTLVSVPEFVIDASALILKNVSLEGIFRKAGSAQRQNEMKKLLDSGKSLPSTIHPIDAACLLKQFLRFLSTPLLSNHTHFLMTRCLELPKEEQQEALSLCSLLLPKTHQDLLAYMLEVFSSVASACPDNRMDAHNLAIVLAPNLLPISKGPHTGGGAKKGLGGGAPWGTDDQLLCSTIDVLELLIDGASGMCRVSKRLEVAVQKREKSQSVENLVEEGAGGPGTGTGGGGGLNVPPKKKRRSGSIQRLVNSLRRVVQGGGVPAPHPTQPPPGGLPSPLKGGATPPILQNRISCVSMAPDVDMDEPVEKAAKRKSDTFEPTQDRLERTLGLFPIEFDRPKKKARIDEKAAKQGGEFRQRVKHSKSVKSMITVQEKNPDNVKRRFSLRERKEIHNPSSFFGMGTTNAERRKSSVGANRSPHQTTPGRTNTPGKTSPGTLSQPALSPLAPKKRMKSFHLPKPGLNAKSQASFRRRDLRHKRPDGSELCLGQRGVPDGAENNLRDSPLKPLSRRSDPIRDLDKRSRRSDPISDQQKRSRRSDPLRDLQKRSRRSDPISDLEKRYDEIKTVVQSMEEEVDRKNMKYLKESYFSGQTPAEFSTMSTSQLIHDAYEKMKMETRELDCSPSENLSRRLGRELKIRSRRSDEHRVVRSPSERRIGTIRRRSKELELNSVKMQTDAPPAKLFTPKLKGHLMQSPQTSLKRGKPNSLRSGLPVVVKASSVHTSENESTKMTPSKTVCISKRRLSSRNSSFSLDSLADSFALSNERSLNQYSGPMTRRKSSLLSSLSNPSPSLNVTPVDNLFDFSFKSLSSGTKTKLMNDSETETEGQNSFTRGCSQLLSSSGKDLSEMESEWISATKFMKDKDDMKFPPHYIEVSGNRPSIAALKEQKKVTANVQLFSQIQSHGRGSTPSHSRRNSYYRHSPPVSHRPGSNPDNVNVRRAERTPLTPLELRRASRIKLSGHRGRTHSPRVAVVSPLQEKNLNSAMLGVSTPKIMSRERRSSSSKIKRTDTFVIPSGLTPLPRRPYKPSHLLTPKMTPSSFETPPKLPPRLSALALSSRKPNQVINYR